MGIWQNLAECYEQNAEVLKTTYPLSTTSISNNSDFIITVVLNGKGDFRRFEKIEKRSKKSKKSSGTPLVSIVIPVTEESMGRSSGVAPHPVFDQFVYLKGSGKKFEAFLAQLKDFAESEFAIEQIKSIYFYIKKRSLAKDLASIKLKDKTFIVFKVETPNNPKSETWHNADLFNAWHLYYVDKKRKRAAKITWAKAELNNKKKRSSGENKKIQATAKLKDTLSLDYITGIDQQPIAIFHPKKISNASANSKLISDNDKSNYTFRGKFSDSSQSVAIGYETSQKAHQFLRYLINDRGYYCSEQVILSFTIGSSKNTLPPPMEDTISILDMLQESQSQTERDSEITLRGETGADYADALKKALAGFGYSETLEQHIKTAVIALDAATTGRLSITFYRELERTEYLEKIFNWHQGCKWHQQFWDKERSQYANFIGAPSVDKIIETIHGQPRSGKDEGYTKIKKTARERLLRCIFDGAFLPRDYVQAAVRRASSPLAITQDGHFDRNSYQQILSTSCALLRKHYQQSKKEEYTLSIEFDRTDRDYLYGRLLGAADKLEEYALMKKANDRFVTAAIRHMQTFSQHPFRTWQTIHNSLNPYIQKVKGSFAFNEIQDVMQQFLSGDYEKDTPLTGSYLIGYYHERAYIDTLVKQAAKKNKSPENSEMEASNDN